MNPDPTPDADAVRAALAAERGEVLELTAALRRDLDAMREAATDGGTDDEHDPEGTTAFERAQAQSLLDAAGARLAELAAAADRLASGTYGTCESCRGPIPSARLLARPVARTCIACAGARR